MRLPRQSVGDFPALFEVIESEGKAKGILSFGIETTTLEEVFMRIGACSLSLLPRDRMTFHLINVAFGSLLTLFPPFLLFFSLAFPLSTAQ